MPTEAHRLTALSTSASATIYTNIAVTPNMTASALQIAIRAKGGVFALAAVLLSSNVILNEVQRIQSAVAVVLTAQDGGVAQTVTPGDTLSAIQTKLAAAKNITDGHIVATGTSTAGTLDITAAFSGVSVAGAGQALFATVTGGVTITRTTAGGFSGTYDITGFTADVDIPDIESVPGAGWTGIVLAQGVLRIGPERNWLSASGSSPASDRGILVLPGGTLKGWSVRCHVTDVRDAASTIALTFKHSDNSDKSVSSILAVFAARGTSGAEEAESVSDVIALKRYVWVEWVIAGGSNAGFAIIPVFSATKLGD